MKYTVEFERPLLTEAIARARARMDNVRADALKEIGSRAEMIAKGLAPKGTGRFEDSIGHEVDRTSVTVGSSSRRAHLVEKGRGPGRMPPPALIESIFSVGKREAYTIARKIGADGTPGAFVFKLTDKAMQPMIDEIASDTARDIGRLSNG